MTFYLRNKQTGKDVLLKHIDVPMGRVTVQTDDGDTPIVEQWRLVDVIEEYDFRYDIW